MSRVNHHSSVQLKKSHAPVSGPVFLKNDSRMVSPGSIPIKEPYIPPADYEGSAKSHDAAFLNNFPATSSISEFPGPHEAFSRNRNCKVSNQIEDNTFVGHNTLSCDPICGCNIHEESPGRQMKNGVVNLNQSIKEPYNPIADYEGSAKSNDAALLNNFPTTSSITEISGPHEAFSRNRNCKVSSQIEDNTFAGYNTLSCDPICGCNIHEESPGRQMKNGEVNLNQPIKEPYIPPADYEGSAKSNDAAFLNNFPATSSISEFSGPHEAFSRNRNCKVSSQIEDNTFVGHNTLSCDPICGCNIHEESPGRQMKNDVVNLNQPFRRIFPNIPADAKFSSQNNAPFQGNRPYTSAETEDDDSSVSYYSITDDCSLYAHCGSLVHQGRSRDKDCSSLGIRSHVQEEVSQAELAGIPRPGFSIESQSVGEIKDCWGVNAGTKISSSQNPVKSTFGVNPQSETDLPNVRKEQRKGEFNLVGEEYGFSFHCDRDKFRLPKGKPTLFSAAKPIRESVNTFYGDSNMCAISKEVVSIPKKDPRTILPTSDRMVPIPVADGFSLHDRKMCQVLPQSPVEQMKSVAFSGVPSKLMNDDRLMSSKNLFTKVPYGPLRNHEQFPVFGHTRSKREFPSLHSSLELLNPPPATFSRKKSNEISIQIDDAVDGSNIYDQPLNHQIRNCGAMNAPCRRDFPPIPTATRFRDTDNAFLQGKRPGAPIGTEDNNSASYYSITDGCSLYAHSGSLMPQRISLADMDCPLLNSWSHAEKGDSQADFEGVINQGYSHESHQLSETQKWADTNGDINVSNDQISRISRFDVSPYHVTDILNNMKDEQIKCGQFIPVQRELSCRSFYDQDMFRQFKDNRYIVNTSEPAYEVFDDPYGDFNVHDISRNVPTTGSDPRIILCPSELPELDPASESFITTDTEDEDSSRHLASRCCPCRCKASQFIVWLTIVLFLLSMLVYLSNEGISPESPLVWMFMLPLLLTVFFGILRGCELC